MLLYNNLIKFVYFLIYFIKNLNIDNKIRFLSNIISPNRVKGPKTDPVPELTEFQKEVIFGLMLGDYILSLNLDSKFNILNNNFNLYSDLITNKFNIVKTN